MTPTHHPVAVSVHVDEKMRRVWLLHLREDNVAVAGHVVLLDVVHDLVVPRHDPDNNKHKLLVNSFFHSEQFQANTKEHF